MSQLIMAGALTKDGRSISWHAHTPKFADTVKGALTHDRGHQQQHHHFATDDHSVEVTSDCPHAMLTITTQLLPPELEDETGTSVVGSAMVVGRVQAGDQ